MKVKVLKQIRPISPRLLLNACAHGLSMHPTTITGVPSGDCVIGQYESLLHAVSALCSCYIAVGHVRKAIRQTLTSKRSISSKAVLPAYVNAKRAQSKLHFKNPAPRLRISLPDVRSRSALPGQRTLVMHFSPTVMEPLPGMSSRANGGLEFHSS